MMRASVFLALALGMGLADSDAKANPVQKVIQVLEEMRATLEKEAKEDEETMSKMVCWCETNDKLKTQAIKDGKAMIAQLEEQIPELAAKGATLTAEVKQLYKDVQQGKNELAEATAIREKEGGEFMQDEKEQIASIGGLDKAITALGAKMSLKQEDSFLQIRGVLTSQSKAVAELPQKQQAQIKAFLQTKTHAPSSEIFGVLKSMKESFEISLADSQKDEKQAQAAFADLKAGKNDEINAATEQRNTKEELNANNVEKLAQSKVDLEDTENTLDADEKFLADLKARCGSMDEEFAQRKQMRAQEQTAVGDALAILTSDDSREQFGKSLGFIQVSSARWASESQTMARSRTHAARFLLETAMTLGSPRLSQLAMHVRGDVFAEIKKAIDQMQAQLKVENKDDIKHKDFCVAELNQNERQQDDAYDQKKSLENRKNDLELQITNLGDEIAAATQSVADMQIEMKKASENRELENHDFQVMISDQRATQDILAKVLEKLKGAYAMVQVKSHQEPAPEGFKEYKKSGGGQGVMMMIETIVEDSQKIEREATAAEQNAQAGYEEFIKNTNNAIEATHQLISEKSEASANARADLARTDADFKDTMKNIEQLSNYAGDLHKQCDFLLKQFEVRQVAREKENEALNEAKNILSGMDA